MRATTCLICVLLLSLNIGAQAQETLAADQKELPPAMAQKMEMLKNMGMAPDEAMFLSLLTSGSTDANQLLPLLLARSGRGGDMDGIGGLLFMRALSGASPASPTGWLAGEHLLLVEGGVLYKINVETMELEGKLAYKQSGGGGVDMMQLLAPVVSRAQEKAKQTSCLSNMKQLSIAFMMYANDNDALPDETWAADIFDYIKNKQVFACASRPEIPVGYAMNEALLGVELANIARPSQTVLLFETNKGGDNPIGGPDDVPDEGVHNEGINCAFADGHAVWVPVEQARDLLEQGL